MSVMVGGMKNRAKKAPKPAESLWARERTRMQNAGVGSGVSVIVSGMKWAARMWGHCRCR